MKKTRGDKTKKRQTKNKKIKGGSRSKSTTRKNDNAISKNEKDKLKLLAIIYAIAINELKFCIYDAFYKIENAELTITEYNFYKEFINCAVNDVFKPLYSTGTIGEKYIAWLIENKRTYINNKSVGGAKSFGNNTQMIIFSIIVILFLANKLASIYELNKLSVVPNKSSKKLYNPNFNKTAHMIELYSGTNAFLKEIKNNDELRKYLTNVFGSCYTISYFYQLSLTHGSEELKERKLKQFAEYFNGIFVKNPPEFGYLPYPFSKILLNDFTIEGNDWGVLSANQGKNQNPLIKYMGVVPVPPSDNQIEDINAILKENIDKSQIHIGGNSTLTTVITENHVLLLMTYYSLGENDEVNVANCVFNPNMITPFFDINMPIHFGVYCDRNFPLPQEMFTEAKVVVVDNILYYEKPVIAIEKPNDRNALNPQPNIAENINLMRRVIKKIQGGLNNQQELFKMFAKNANNKNYKKLFEIAYEELEKSNEASNRFFSPHSTAKKSDMLALMNSDEQKLLKLLRELSPEELWILRQRFKKNELYELHSFSRKK